MYKYILLDWDGTLAKTLHVWLGAYQKVFNEDGLTPTDEQIISKAFGQREAGMQNIGSKNPRESWGRVVEEVNKNVVNVTLYDGALDLLNFINEKNLKVALLTQSDRNTVVPPIEKNGLEKYFKVILTKDDVVNKKPDPEIFLKALDRLGGNKEEALIVGDSYHDLKGGKNAGIDTAAFYPSENEMFYRKADLEKENSNFFISSLEELTKII